MKKKPVSAQQIVAWIFIILLVLSTCWVLTVAPFWSRIINGG